MPYLCAGQISSGLWASRASLFPGEQEGHLDKLPAHFESPCLRPVSSTVAEKSLIPSALHYTKCVYHEVLAFVPNKLWPWMSYASALWNPCEWKAMITEMSTRDAAGNERLRPKESRLVKGTRALILKAVLSMSSLHGKLSQERTSVFSVC